MNPRRAIFRRYALVLSVALAGSLLVYGTVEVAFSTRENLERAREIQVSKANLFAQRVELAFQEIVRSLNSVAASPMGSGRFSTADRRDEYERVMQLYSTIADVTFADDSGREILFVSRTLPTRVNDGRMLDLATLDRAQPKIPYYGEVRQRNPDSAPSVQVVLRDPKPSKGFTVATLNLAPISGELAEMRRSGEEVPYVVDARGRLVAHHDASRPLQAEPFGGADPYADIPNDGGRWRRAANGSLVLSVAHRIDNPPWTVLLDTPWQQALKPVLSTTYRALAFIAVAVLMAVLISRWLADRLVRPVMALRKGAETLGSGELQHRIDLKTGDELEELGAKFNEMAQQLQDYTVGLERKVDERTTELRAAMRARALFLAAASHDLRQPLYAVSILTDALALQPLPPNASSILAKQQQAVGVLRGLFDNLLDLSRFEAGEVRAVFRVVSLREVLVPLANEFEVLCHTKALGWKSDIADAWVRTDPELLRRLLSNLLSNAVRYTRAGSVSLIAKVEGSSISILVSDTGVGIAPEDQARVFEEFVQLGNPARERERGIGLGLSIVRKIDALLDTRLRMQSVPGMGTTITLQVEHADSVEAPPPTEAFSMAADEFAGMRLWVVEDDPMVRDALATQFSAWSIDHEFARTRAEVQALRESDGDWPDAVMLDDMLSEGERGLEIARWLRQHISADRIILVTGNVEPSRALELEESGFTVMRKPLSSAEFAQWLRGAARAAKEPVPRKATEPAE